MFDEIIAQQGTWTIWRNRYGYVGLTHEARGKSHDITEGPRWAPPRWMALKYVNEFYGGDIDEAGGRYGAPVLRKALGMKEN